MSLSEELLRIAGKLKDMGAPKRGSSPPETETFKAWVRAVSGDAWVPLTRQEAAEFWENEDDLVDRWSIYSPKQLRKALVPIPPELQQGLQNFDDNVIELFNRFDIWLKDSAFVTMVDFIDYDAGQVWLIKPFYKG